jgi:PAS domain S-box-containing protein
MIKKAFSNFCNANNRRDFMHTGHYLKFIQQMQAAYCHMKAISDEKDSILDYEIVDNNRAFAVQYNKTREDLSGRNLTKLFGGTNPKEFKWMNSYAIKMEEDDHAEEIRFCNITQRWYKVFIYCPCKGELVLLYLDITDGHTKKIVSADLQKQQKLLSEITTSLHYTKGHLIDFVNLLTYKAAHLFKTSMADVWLIDESGSNLICFDNYSRTSNTHRKGQVIEGFRIENEVKLLAKERYIYALDAIKDPRVQFFKRNHIKPAGIRSVLMAAIMQGGEIKGVFCLSHCKKPGEWSQHEINFACQLADHIAIVLTFSDQKIAKEQYLRSKAKIESIFSAAPSGMGLVRNRILLEVNDKLCFMTGYTQNELIGQNARLLYENEEDFKHVGEEKYSQIREVGLGTIETRWKKKTGEIINVLLSSAPLDIHDWSLGITFTATDITERVKRQQLEQQLQVALKSSEFKKNFLANMSHEMRTPLTGILGITEILAQTKLDCIQQEYLNILNNSSENLMEIINQVLDFSKIEQGLARLNYHDFSLHSILNEAQDYFHMICEKEIDFELRIDHKLPRLIEADRNRIQQIIHNLLSNAVKFTPWGRITLDAVVEDVLSDNKWLIKITISDTGIGIPPERENDVFSPFMQVDNNDTRKYEGTGLGLAISRNLARLHGGDLKFITKLGKGSSFWFTFIANPVTAEIPQPFTEAEESNYRKNLKILFAEDKMVNQKVIQLMLSTMGHDIVIAKNGKEVLELFDKEKFDLVLMDIQMPEMNGLTAINILRSKFDKLPPIVGLSANGFEGDKEKYLSKGMDAYLTKPLRKQEMEDILRYFFPG